MTCRSNAPDPTLNLRVPITGHQGNVRLPLETGHRNAASIGSFRTRRISHLIWPCETRTSTCRNFATISSGLYRFLAITVLLDVKRHTSSRTTSTGPDQNLELMPRTRLRLLE